MVNQFLLNPDGSIPEWADVEALRAAGVIFVRPTTLITPKSDNQLVELDPVMVDGVWWQQWGEEPIPPAPAPDRSIMVCTMRQARLALLQVGKLVDVDAAIAAMPEPQRSHSKIEWEYSTEVQRTNSLVLNLGPALGMSDNDLDMLFALASTL